MDPEKMRTILTALTIAATLTAIAAPAAADPARDAVIVKTLMRLPNADISAREDLKAAVLRHMATVRGTAEYIELAKRFRFKAVSAELFKLAIGNPTGAQGAAAASLLLDNNDAQALTDAFSSSDDKQAMAAVTAVSKSGNAKAVALLAPLVTAPDKYPVAIRTAAVRGLAANLNGQKQLLKFAANGTLPADVEFVAADALLSSVSPLIKAEATKRFKRPNTGDSQPLLPLSQLVKARGNVTNGHHVFRNKGTCIKCHKIGEEGKDVGPALTEIGSKLSREAIFVSILAPSAGISHNYETYLVATEEGQLIVGLKVSETKDQIVIKNAEAIVHTIAKDEIEELSKQPVSLMPQDLQKNMTQQELIDVVTYLQTLKKKP